MSSVSSTNPVLNSLLQTLSSMNSPVMASPKAVAALEKASGADIATLSDEAMQLQNVDLIFGAAAGTSNTDSAGADLLSSLAESLTPATAPSPTTASSALQSAESSQPLLNLFA